MAAPIYVVVSSDDLTEKHRKEHPGRAPNPIVFETNVIGATFERERDRAADLERSGYGACRVGRVVFEDAPAPAAAQPQGDMAALARIAERNWTLALDATRDLLRQINERGVGHQFDLTKVVEALAGTKPMPAQPPAEPHRETSPEIPF